MDDTPSIPIEELMQHRPWVRKLARQLVLDDAEVDDIEQQTWLAALQRPPRSIGVMAWLSSVVRNLASKRRRSDTRRFEHETQAARTEKVPATDQVIVDAERHEELIGALRGLSEPYRTTLLMRYFEGLPPRDIAIRMAVPVETVRVRTRRGLEHLREYFDRRYASRQDWHAALLPLIAPKFYAGAVASTNLGAILMSTSTKLITVVVIFTSIVWYAWPDPPEMSHKLAATAKDPVVPAETGLVPLASDSAQTSGTISIETPRKQVSSASVLPEKSGAERPGTWLRVTRSGSSHPACPPAMTARFVDSKGVTHTATGKLGDLKVPEQITNAAVLWLTTPDDGGLHRFAARRYPEGTTTLNIKTAMPLEIRFVTASGRTLHRPEIERRYSAAGLTLSAKWIGAGRFAASNAIRSILTPPPGDLWTRQVAFTWHGTTLRVNNTPTDGGWRMLFTPAQSPSVLIDIPDYTAGESRLIEVRVPHTPWLQKVRFVDADTGTPLPHSKVTPYYEYGDDEAFFAGVSRITDSSGELLIPIPTESKGRGRPSCWWIETDSHIGYVTTYRFSDHPDTYIHRVARKAIIRGKAFTAEGQPAIGATVTHLRKGYARRCKVDVNGRYELIGVFPESRAVVVLITDSTTMELQHAQAEVLPGDTIELDIGHPVDPDRFATLRGRITAGGMPIEDAMVALEARARSTVEATVGQILVRTNAKGEYILKGVPPGPAELRVILGDFRVSDSYGLVSNPKALALVGGESLIRDFALPDGFVEVQILDAAGEPLVGIDVRAEAETPDLASDRFPGFRYRMGWGGKSDARGRVLLQGLLLGTPMRIFGRDSSSDWKFEQREVKAGTRAMPKQLVIRRPD